MGWLVVLVVTNCLTLTLLIMFWRRERDQGDQTADVFTAPRPSGVTTRSRRLITIEVLNPIELVGTRGGWVAGLAGSLAPGIARRVVYDQVLKTLRRELADKQVVADVRLHELRPAPLAPTAVSEPPVAVDEVTRVELTEAGPAPIDPDQL